MDIQTIHTNENGTQETRRVVQHGAVEYEFRVDLDATEDPDADGHEYLGDDRDNVPAAVENALTEYGAGPAGGDE